MTKVRKKSKPQAANRTPGKKAALNSSDMLETTDTIDADANANAIDTIRDILFGRQMANYDDRFAQLEAQINSQIAAMGERMANRLKGIEALIEKQNDALTGRLNDEQSERNEGAAVLSREIVDVKKSLLTSIETLNAQQAMDIQTVKEQMSKLANDLSDEIYIQQVEVSNNLEQAVQELDDAKLARKALSQLLAEMAGRLTDNED